MYEKKIFDVTRYLRHHPGLGMIIYNLAGKDMKQEFD